MKLVSQVFHTRLGNVVVGGFRLVVNRRIVNDPNSPVRDVIGRCIVEEDAVLRHDRDVRAKLSVPHL